MNRKELVAAGARALAAEGVDTAAGLACDGLAWVVLDAVEPIIRAEVIRENNEVLPATISAEVSVVLADLRAKVEGLPPHGPGESMFVWRDDVLALLDEEAQR